ncbi:COG4223 family protein [Phaeovulum sp.]|uniref:COG4223 family protein n=1 Tax=Phaeovulum sp. TaxID=2934796 RepID=UPI00272FCF57|nr:hypothetical protein [Phaeovulum sp.]MDP1669081.1 hypothetical protein [Phaeovulum sp.]MDZ4117720.1 hypothetical protein [Phaeovulum sp.]
MARKASETPEPAATNEPAEPVLIPEPKMAALAEPTEVAPEPARKRRGTFLPLLLGGVVAAALGAGATMYLLPLLPARWQPASALLAENSAEQVARFDALRAELAALRAAVPQAPDLGPLQAALAEAEARLAAVEARPAPVMTDATPAVEALRDELAALRTELAAGTGSPQTTSAEIAAAAAEASARIVAAETEAAAVRARAEADAAALRAEAEASASRALARASAAQLAAAIESGAPLAEAVAQLRLAGVDVPRELAAEVPTLAALRDGFVPAARAALAAARAEAPGAGMLDRLGTLLLAQTGARSLTAREGADADAVLSRAEAALAAGDLTAALAEIAALPDAARAEMAIWQALAERRLAATRALADLAQSLN